MMLGHGRRHLDWAAAAGDALLGAAWVLFVWSVLGQLLRLALLDRGRRGSGAVTGGRGGGRRPWWRCSWCGVTPKRCGFRAIRNVDVAIDRLGSGLDGLRVAMITDTHYGPIDRARWSAAVVARVNELGADVVCHVGDIADGTVDVREAQASPLASVNAHVGPRVRHRQPRVLQRGPGLAGLHGEHRLGCAAQPAHRRRDAAVTGSSSPAWTTRRRKASGVARTRREPRGRPRGSRPRHCRSFCSRINPSRSRTRCARASTCRSPVTPTAARSGRSTSLSDWTNRWCTD